MKDMKMPKHRIISVAVLLILMSSGAHAGGAATGGASEVTQVMNNGELIASVSKQAQIVSGQIRDFTVQVNHYSTALQNLKNLPVAVVAKALAPYKETLKSLGELYVATNDVYTSSSDAFNVLQKRRAEMQAMNLTPTEYLNSEMLLAQTKGGVYKQQAERDVAFFKKAEEKSIALAGMESQINAVSGNVQGFQLLAQQNQLMAGELMELNSQLRTKSLQDNQAKAQEQLLIAENKKREIEMNQQVTKQSTATERSLNDGKYSVEENRKKLFKDM